MGAASSSVVSKNDGVISSNTVRGMMPTPPRKISKDYLNKLLAAQLRRVGEENLSSVLLNELPAVTRIASGVIPVDEFNKLKMSHPIRQVNKANARDLGNLLLSTGMDVEKGRLVVGILEAPGVNMGSKV